VLAENLFYFHETGMGIARRGEVDSRSKRQDEERIAAPVRNVQKY
jgi:hypothetical protein